jgi:hypothetical protein
MIFTIGIIIMIGITGRAGKQGMFLCSHYLGLGDPGLSASGLHTD